MTGQQLLVLADAYRDHDVRTAPVEDRDVTAKLRLTELRRGAAPERRTWSPFDPEPDDSPGELLDADGDTWHRNPRSRRWRMDGYSPALHEPTAGRALTWAELALSYGPLTTPPDQKEAAS